MIALLRDAGFQRVERVPTDGKPAVFATLDAGAKRTVGLYFMYDVKQFDPKEWSSPPLEARIVERAADIQDDADQPDDERELVEVWENTEAGDIGDKAVPDRVGTETPLAHDDRTREIRGLAFKLQPPVDVAQDHGAGDQHDRRGEHVKRLF